MDLPSISLVSSSIKSAIEIASEEEKRKLQEQLDTKKALKYQAPYYQKKLNDGSKNGKLIRLQKGYRVGAW